MPNVDAHLYIKSPSILEKIWTYILILYDKDKATKFIKSRIMYRHSPNEEWKKLY